MTMYGCSTQWSIIACHQEHDCERERSEDTEYMTLEQELLSSGNEDNVLLQKNSIKEDRLILIPAPAPPQELSQKSHKTNSWDDSIMLMLQMLISVAELSVMRELESDDEDSRSTRDNIALSSWFLIYASLTPTRRSHQ